MTLRHRFLGGFALFAAVFSGPVAAQNNDQGMPTPEVIAIGAASINEANVFSRAGRNNFVAEINKYCRYIDYIFPKNTPSEREWLFAEKSGSIERKLKAADSVQNARENVKWFAWQCINSSDNFQSKGNKERTGSLISLSRAFSVLSHQYPKQIETLTGISSNKTGFFWLEDLTDQLILAAFLEHAGCDTSKKFCETPVEGKTQ